MTQRSTQFDGDARPRRPRLALLGAVIMIVSVTTVGCTQASTKPAPTMTPDITLQQILPHMAVPAMCQRPAGTLVDGARNWTDPDPGNVWVQADTLVRGELNGDGIQDAVIVVDCSAGGVNWGPQILAYTPDGNNDTKLIGSFWSTDVKLPGNARASRPGLSSPPDIDNGEIHFRMMAQMEDDAEAGPSLPVDVTLHYLAGKGLALKDTKARWDEGTASKAVTLGETGDMFSDTGEQAAIKNGYARDKTITAAIAHFNEYALNPGIQGCYDSAAQAPWTPDGTDPSPPQPDERARYCLVVQQGALDNRAALLTVLPTTDPKWTVTHVQFGTRT